MSHRIRITAVVSIVCAVFLSACAQQSMSTSTAGRTLLGGGKVTYNDTKWCVPRQLKKVLKDVSYKFGPVSVHSTKRRWLENRRKGGAKNSYHRHCRAVDFAIRGNPDPQAVMAYLKSKRGVGGYSYYPGGHYHIDNGPRRTW